jgi:hypothetical protein
MRAVAVRVVCAARLGLIRATRPAFTRGSKQTAASVERLKELQTTRPHLKLMV